MNATKLAYIAVIGSIRYFCDFKDACGTKVYKNTSEIRLRNVTFLRVTEEWELQGLEILDVLELQDADEALVKFAKSRVRQEIK